MGAVIANMSMSLDGFVEDRHGSVAEVFRWYTAGPVATTAAGDGREFRTDRAGAERLEEAFAATGAVVCGRTLYDLTGGWGGRHPTGAPVVVVTHRPPDEHPPTCSFVTAGVAAAVARARELAGDATVAVASADVARQCLDLGLLDGIVVDLVPVVLGAGRPFLAGAAGPVRLGDPTVTAGAGVTHLHYPVLR